MLEKINKIAQFIKSKTNFEPEIGIILGTGLGALVKEIEILYEISYTEIEGFPVSTVESHKGRFIFGILGNKKVITMQGRFHYYEGYSMDEVTLPVRIMKVLGIKRLLISNACGGLNPDFRVTDLMMIEDHINLLPEHPLRGKNIDELGPRFPDMSAPYDKEMNRCATRIARDLNIRLHKGIYLATSGPTLETRAEYRYMRVLGADVVGMSTVPEVIVARHMGLPCFAVSVITDMCTPQLIREITIHDVLEAARVAEPKMTALLKELIIRTE